ncbi:MAG TPA: hypothetical protein PKX02_03095 [Candidatus Sabulitectum sp.]|nr:hypothetical protein [Candidatus Sabulitectum sp.]
MNYDEAERWLFGRRRMGMKYGLDRMLSIMEELGHPEERFKTVHIVGTNGKGSTAAILSALAGELGFKWGRGTSPHLLHYRERIATGDGWITPDEVAEFVTDNIHMLRKHSATFFEITTAMAAWHFAGKGVDWVAAEAGLGGRLDATKTYRGAGTIFTGVRVEHSRILGDTREKIASEKVAVAEPGTVLVAFRQTPGVEAVLESATSENGLRRVIPKPVSRSPLPGEHQLRNSALALAAAEELFHKPGEDIALAYERVLETLKWPGRLDYRSGNPSILFDVAHNPQSMSALAAHVEKWKRPVPAVVGFLGDKPWKTMVSLLRGVVDPVFTTTPCSERRLPAEELASYMRNEGFDARPVDPIGKAVSQCRKHAEGGRMIVTGSFFVVGDALNRAVEAGWVGGVPESGPDGLD